MARDPAELAEESARRRAEVALEAWARKPLSYNPINNPLAAGPQAAAGAPADKLPAMLERALANPRRLRTPARQRTAFLEQFARCGSVLEAALRAGVNRGTVYRWKAKDPDFARRWADAIRRHAEEVGDDIALQAMIHVQNRMDADRRRTEDRAERRELLLLRVELAQRSREIRSSEKRRAATPAATLSVPEMCSEDLGLPTAA
ncbi:MAG: hypothetical protein Q8K93_12110 [Reyranella sp.]|nr:hypothetical protein [Reyranella sp.]